MSTDTSWISPSCTLPTAEQPLRVAEFAAVFATALTNVHRASPSRLFLEFRDDERSEVERLTQAETQCCSFFAFSFSSTVADRFILTVEVPPSYTGVLDGLVGMASQG